MRDRSVVKSSVIPSTKYSCSGSLDALLNGRTMIDSGGTLAGLPDIDAGGALGEPVCTAVVRPNGPRKTHSAAAHRGVATSATAYQFQDLLRMLGRGSSLGRLAMA